MMKTVKKKWFLFVSTVVVCLILLYACGVKNDESLMDADHRVVEGYDQTVAYFQKNTSLNSYWAVFAAYAALDNQIQQGVYTYDSSNEDSSQQGAITLAKIMMGENPYNDQGQDLITPLLEKGVEGNFSIPVFNFLALQAAGADIDADTEAAFVNYCCEQLQTLSLGPDIGGWAAVALERYIDNPKYSTAITAAIDGYTAVVGENLTSGTMGSTGISAGCVVTGLTALTDAGLKGYDPTKDNPWLAQDPLAVMYENLTKGEKNVSTYYDSQYYLEFADLYQVLYKGKDMAWIRCGVNQEKLNKLITNGEALAAKHTGDKILATALSDAKALGEDELSAAVPSWGSTYYALYDAVKQYE